MTYHSVNADLINY